MPVRIFLPLFLFEPTSHAASHKVAQSLSTCFDLNSLSLSNTPTPGHVVLVSCRLG